MRLTSKRLRREVTVVPMINVAFLLLVFFLMTAVLTPVDPKDIAIPTARNGSDAMGVVVTLSANGSVARGELLGDGVFAGLTGQSIQIRADAKASGADLARLLSRLAASGVEDVSIITAHP